MRSANAIKTLFPLLLMLAPSALIGQTPPVLGQSKPSSVFTLGPQLDAIGLRVEAHDAVKTITSNYGRYDFGLTLQLENRYVEQTFLLWNDSKSPLEKLRLKYSHPASLQAMLVLKSGKGLAPQPLGSDLSLPSMPPNAELAIRVKLDLSKVPSGPILERVIVESQGQPHPVALMELTGEQVPLVTFQPASLDFGQLSAGQSSTRIVTVQIHPRLAPAGSVPKLICTQPDVRIEAIPLDPGAKRKSPVFTEDQKKAGLYSFRLTLPADASIGTISGTVSVAYISPPPPSNKKTEPPLSSSVVTEALHSAILSLTGRIEGDLTVAPDTISFGSVVQGKQEIQQVTLRPKDVTILKNIKINSPCAWLSARLTLPTGVPPAGIQVGGSGIEQNPILEVLLRPEAPAGRLQSQLTLTLSNGQRLVLPVSALVIASLSKPLPAK